MLKKPVEGIVGALLLVFIPLVIALVALIFLAEFWIGIQIVTLILAGEFLVAYGWCAVFTILIAAVGLLKELTNGASR